MSEPQIPGGENFRDDFIFRGNRFPLLLQRNLTHATLLDVGPSPSKHPVVGIRIWPHAAVTVHGIDGLRVRF